MAQVRYSKKKIDSSSEKYILPYPRKIERRHCIKIQITWAADIDNFGSNTVQKLQYFLTISQQN